MRFVLPVLLAAVAAGCASRPPAASPVDVVPREAWGAAPADPSAMAPMGRVRHVTVHHTATTVADAAAEPGHLVSIQRGHQVRDHAWGDVAYHYLVGPSGTVYAGRAEAYAPASGTVYLTDAQRTAAGQNDLGQTAASVPVAADGTPVAPPGASEGHLAIVVIGNYEEALPPPAARDALVRLVAQKLHEHGLGVDDVLFHREAGVGTVCPGQALYDWFRGPARGVGARGEGLRQIEAALDALRS